MSPLADAPSRTLGLRAVFMLVLFVGALAWPRSSQAQAATYAELLRDAQREEQANAHVEARVAYRKAHALHPSGTTALGIARAAMALGDYVDAAQTARLALASDVATATEQGELTALLERSRRFVGEYVVDLYPRDAELAIDGQPVTLAADRVLVLAEGRHTVHALAEGFVPISSEVHTRAGERTTLDVVLDRRVAPRSIALDAESAEDGEGDGDGVSVVPIILVSVGAATLLAGGITGLVALDNEGDLEDRCGDAPELCPKHNSALGHSAEDLAVATNVLWVVGGLTAAVGTTWLVLELTDDERATAALDVAPGHAGLRFASRF